MEGILQRLPVTMMLTLCAMAIGLLVALPVGIISRQAQLQAGRRGTLFAMSGVAIPDFGWGSSSSSCWP